MGYWDYTNIGVSVTPENEKHVRSILGYIGYGEEPDYSGDGDDCYYPDRTGFAYVCLSSAETGFGADFKEGFSAFSVEDLLYLMNALFAGTIIEVHHAEGNNTSDTWEKHKETYNPNTRTYSVYESYTDYGGGGPTGDRSWEKRFAMKPPKMEHVQALINLSAADCNSELTAKLMELSRQLRDGLIVYEEDPADKRKIGRKYKVKDNVVGEEDEEKSTRTKKKEKSTRTKKKEKSTGTKQKSQMISLDEFTMDEDEISDFNMDEGDLDDFDLYLGEKPVDAPEFQADIITFGHYPQTKAGDDRTPIEWFVLKRDGNRALVISRYGLDARPYHSECHSNSWVDCSLRAWLNQSFLNVAFTEAEQEAILITEVDNGSVQGNPVWKTAGGNNTQDKVFLLSWSEAKKLFGSDPDRRCAVTPFAESNGAYSNDSYLSAGRETGGWWLRSPGSNQLFAAYVSSDGSLRHSIFLNRVASVRPSFWINLDSGIF